MEWLVNNATWDLENMRSQSLDSKLSMELAKAEMNLLFRYRRKILV